MAQGYTGLKFILEGGAFIGVVVSEFEARQIVSGFMNGTLKPVIGNPEGPFGGCWSVLVGSIKAIHTFSPQEILPQQAPQQYQANPHPGGLRYGEIPGRLTFGSGL